MKLMTLTQGQHYAERIVEWLAPFCERVEIVGSIRRRRPIVNDVDLVAVPKYESRRVQVDLLSAQDVRVNLLRAALVDYVAQSEGKAHWLGREGKPGPEPKLDGVNLLVHLPKCQLDVWCATEENYATLRLCRTGSKEHNIWLCSRAITKFGGKWDPYRGLTMDGQHVPARSERDIYAALGLDFIDPVNREMNFLRTL